MFRVQVPIPSTEELPRFMSAMREWLDRNRCEAVFSCTSQPVLLCHVDFRAQGKAALFAHEFRGELIGPRTDPNGLRAVEMYGAAP